MAVTVKLFHWEMLWKLNDISIQAVMTMMGGVVEKMILVWVKVMCDEFDEVTAIIGLVINFLAFGTPLLSFCDTSS